MNSLFKILNLQKVGLSKFSSAVAEHVWLNARKVEIVGNWIVSTQGDERKGHVTLPDCLQSSSSKIHRYKRNKKLPAPLSVNNSHEHVIQHAYEIISANNFDEPIFFRNHNWFMIQEGAEFLKIK